MSLVLSYLRKVNFNLLCLNIIESIILGNSTDQQPISDEVRQQILRLQQEDADSSAFRTRTVNQPPISISPPKISELTSRGDSYHMIPIERMEQIRQETAHVLDIGVDGEQQSKIKKLTGKKKKAK